MKENKNIFPSLLEKVLVDIWGGVGDRLSTQNLKTTRAGISYIRRVYRHRGEHVYVVSESGTMWALEVMDTLEATALLPSDSIIIPPYL
jgi:hypothetical protein